MGGSAGGVRGLVECLVGRPGDLIVAFVVAAFFSIMPRACAVCVRETARRTGRGADTGQLAFVAYLTLLIPVFGLTLLEGGNEAIGVPIIIFAGAVSGFVFSLPWVTAAIYRSTSTPREEE